MAYSFTQDVPIDAAMYRRILDGVGAEPPKGLVVHVATENPNGGLRYFDLWEAEKDFDRFAQDRLHPVVQGLLSEIFGQDLPPEPDRTSWPVIHVWRPETTS